LKWYIERHGGKCDGVEQKPQLVSIANSLISEKLAVYPVGSRCILKAGTEHAWSSATITAHVPSSGHVRILPRGLTTESNMMDVLPCRLSPFVPATPPSGQIMEDGKLCLECEEQLAHNNKWNDAENLYCTYLCWNTRGEVAEGGISCCICCPCNLCFDTACAVASPAVWLACCVLCSVAYFETPNKGHTHLKPNPCVSSNREVAELIMCPMLWSVFRILVVMWRMACSN